jgi:L-asparaginase
MNNKHIAIIYTGGTIGMCQTAKGYAPAPDFPAELQALLAAQPEGLPRYTLHAYPEPIDSANATPRDWQQIGRDIAARYADYDGFVLLHGTDTMAYTASALSYMLQGLRKPVIVTGAQIPMGVEGSDAPHNLVDALRFAAFDEISEVAICFAGRLLRGNRASKLSSEDLYAFDSLNYPRLAEMNDGVHVNRQALLPRAVREDFQLPEYGECAVLPLRFVPGLPLSAIQALLDLQPQAVILQCYGSGNVPDRDPALFQMLSRASEAGIVIVACSQSPHGRVIVGRYATGAGLRAVGVVGAHDMSFEAIFTKLHYLFALGLSPEEVRTRFALNLSGELTTE